MRKPTIHPGSQFGRKQKPIGSRRVRTIGRAGYMYPTWQVKVALGGHEAWAIEHRCIMERLLGRTLSTSEVVHHKDGNHLNNDPSNLELTSRTSHFSSHGLPSHPQAEAKRIPGSYVNRS